MLPWHVRLGSYTMSYWEFRDYMTRNPLIKMQNLLSKAYYSLASTHPSISTSDRALQPWHERSRGVGGSRVGTLEGRHRTLPHLRVIRRDACLRQSLGFYPERGLGPGSGEAEACLHADWRSTGPAVYHTTLTLILFQPNTVLIHGVNEVPSHQHNFWSHTNK